MWPWRGTWKLDAVSGAIAQDLVLIHRISVRREFLNVGIFDSCLGRSPAGVTLCRIFHHVLGVMG
ncbi:MAG: hypothetical protein ACFE0J_07655 [Elainellaceae cyanobacterium]